MILLAADSMIKIITLPDNAAMPGRMAFPGSDEIHHAISRIPTKRDQSVQMVGHNQSQLDPPSTFFMVKCHRLKQLAYHCWIVQRCLAAFFAVDRDEKCRVSGNPNRRTMRLPSGLTIGHGILGHWKSSTSIRPMSKRVSKALGRALSPKGPICECNGNADAYSFTADALEKRPCLECLKRHVPHGTCSFPSMPKNLDAKGIFI